MAAENGVFGALPALKLSVPARRGAVWQRCRATVAGEEGRRDFYTKGNWSALELNSLGLLWRVPF